MYIPLQPPGTDKYPQPVFFLSAVYWQSYQQQSQRQYLNITQDITICNTRTVWCYMYKFDIINVFH